MATEAETKNGSTQTWAYTWTDGDLVREVFGGSGDGDPDRVYDHAYVDGKRVRTASDKDADGLADDVESLEWTATAAGWSVVSVTRYGDGTAATAQQVLDDGLRLLSLDETRGSQRLVREVQGHGPLDWPTLEVSTNSDSLSASENQVTKAYELDDAGRMVGFETTSVFFVDGEITDEWTQSSTREWSCPQ